MNVDEYPSDAVYMHFIIQIDVGINMELCMFNCFDVLKTLSCHYCNVIYTYSAYHKGESKIRVRNRIAFYINSNSALQVYEARKKIFFFLLFLLLLYCNYPKLSILTSLSFAGDGADEDDDGFT